jgi:predicted DNA-binding transcriptional regulator AlpA
MRKRNISQREQEQRARQSAAAIEQGLPQIDRRWVTGPTLRKNLNISPPTLWRWRHNPSMAFPTATIINGRLYFRWDEVQAWIAKQQQAA